MSGMAAPGISSKQNLLALKNEPEKSALQFGGFVL
jgi:hypothetical protein